MFYLILLFEGACLTLLLLLFYSGNRRLIAAVAAATLASLFLGLVSALATGFFGISFWLYALVKAGLVTLVLDLARLHSGFSARAIAPEFHRALARLESSPLEGGVLLLFAFLFLCAATRYPLEWDSYSYHLPLAVDFLKHGVASQYQYYGNSVGAYYPRGVELLYAVYFSLCGIERSALVNFPALVLLFSALFLLARDVLKVRKEHAVLGALAFLFLPFVQRHFFEAYVDLYFLAFGLLALYYLLRFRKSGEPRKLLLFGVALGWLVATKSSGLPLALAFLVATLPAFFRSAGTVLCKGGRALGVLGCLLPGGAFYLFNALNAGNPFFPMKLSLFGFDLPGHFQPGELIRQTSVLFPFFEGSTSETVRRIVNGVVADLSVGLPLLLALMILALGHWLRRRPITPEPGVRWFLGLAALALLLFAVTPYGGKSTAGDLVFSFRLAGLVLAPVFLVLLRRPGQDGRLLTGLLGGTLLFLPVQSFIGAGAGPVVLILLVALAGGLWVILRAYRIIRFACAGVVLAAGLFLNVPWQDPPYAGGAPPGLAVAYTGSNKHFQLYDRKLSINLVTVNVNRPQDQKWDRETDLSFYKTQGDERQWLRNLQETGAEFLVVLNPGDDIAFAEREWVKKFPDIFSNQGGGIFRVDREELARTLAVL